MFAIIIREHAVRVNNCNAKYISLSPLELAINLSHASLPRVSSPAKKWLLRAKHFRDKSTPRSFVRDTLDSMAEAVYFPAQRPRFRTAVSIQSGSASFGNPNTRISGSRARAHTSLYRNVNLRARLRAVSRRHRALFAWHLLHPACSFAERVNHTKIDR